MRDCKYIYDYGGDDAYEISVLIYFFILEGTKSSGAVGGGRTQGRKIRCSGRKIPCHVLVFIYS